MIVYVCITHIASDTDVTQTSLEIIHWLDLFIFSSEHRHVWSSCLKRTFFGNFENFKILYKQTSQKAEVQLHYADFAWQPSLTSCWQVNRVQTMFARVVTQDGTTIPGINVRPAVSPTCWKSAAATEVCFIYTAAVLWHTQNYCFLVATCEQRALPSWLCH